MKTLRSTFTSVLVAGLMVPALTAGAAPDAPAKPKAAAPAAPDPQAMAAAMARMGAVGENHKRLESLVGEWTTETKMWMDPSQAPGTSAGTNSNRILMGGRYLQSIFKGDMMGAPFEGLGTLGYDNGSGRYVATWIDSMTTGIFHATGTYDPATKAITMRGEMPNMVAPKTMVKVRTVTRFVDADTYVFEWHETNPGIPEHKTLEVTYKRKK